MDVNEEYASKGVAGAGLGTGIAGLSLGVINSLGGLGALGGLFGSRANAAAQNDILTAMLTAGMVQAQPVRACGSDCDPVTQREMHLVQQLAEKDTQIALRDANTFTDQKNLEMYQYIDGRLKELAATLSAQAVQNQANKDSFAMLQQQMASDKAAIQTEICCEREARKSADDIIVNYVNATFYPKMVAAVTTGTDTTAQAVYNPLPACNCGCSC